METYYRKYAQKEEVLDVYEKKNEKNGQPYAGNVHDGSVSYGLRLGEGE